MKKVLLSLLAVVLIVGALGAAGFAGYQFGLRRSALVSSNGTTQVVPRGRDFDFGSGRMPMHNFMFNRGFERGVGMMGRGGMGFGFFSPLMFLLRIAFWALVIWAVYMLIARSGWRLTKTQPAAVQAVPTETSSDSEKSESNPS